MMVAWELIKETVLRRGFIPIVHLALCCSYAVLPLCARRHDFILGHVPFVLGGVLLPAILSTGIFGNDMVSGRIFVLVTKPIRFSELYLWRWFGLTMQGLLHLLVAGMILVTVHRLGGHGSSAHLHVWLFLSLLLFSAVAALSTTLSIVVKRSDNVMFMIGILLCVVVFKMYLASAQTKVTEIVDALIKYGLPSVEILYQCGAPDCAFSQRLGAASHVMALTGLYGAIGIALLHYKEFKRQCDS